MIAIESNSDEVKKYVKNVKKNAKARDDRIKNSFANFMQNKKWFKKKIIYTTWSDGRLENKSHDWLKSNLELVIAQWFEYESEYPLAKSADELSSVIRKNVSFILDNIEIKKVWEDSMVLFNNDSNLVFPTRIWDSLPIWWNCDLYNNLRKLVSLEIISNHQKFNEYFVRRLAVHKRATKNWFSKFRNDITTQIDFENWKLFYDPENYNEWVKYWPLRVIQYSLALSLLRKIRNLWEHPEFVEYLPTNILDRIDFLLDNNLTKLSKNEAEHIKYIYAYFLKIYHQIQFEYSFNETKEFLLARDDLKDIKEMLSYLADSLTIDKLIV